MVNKLSFRTDSFTRSSLPFYREVGPYVGNKAASIRMTTRRPILIIRTLFADHDLRRLDGNSHGISKL
jgi:hypothetical protein